MKKMIMLLASVFLLAACGSGQDQEAVANFNNELNDYLVQSDEQFESFLAVVDEFENGSTNEEEAANQFDELKAEMTQTSDAVYNIEIATGASDELQTQLNDTKDLFATALFERAKSAGHYRDYVSSGDESHATQVLERAEAFNEEIKEAQDKLEELKTSVGVQ